MMPTLLLTDALIWLLVFGVLAYARSVVKNPLSRASWGLVFQSKIASASLVVLLSRSSSWIGAWWVGSKWRK